MAKADRDLDARLDELKTRRDIFMDQVLKLDREIKSIEQERRDRIEQRRITRLVETERKRQRQAGTANKKSRV